MFANKMANAGEHTTQLFWFRFAALSIGADYHWSVTCRPGYGNVAERILAIIASLVGDLTVRRQTRTQQGGASLAVHHPVGEAGPGRWRKHVSEQEAEEIT